MRRREFLAGAGALVLADGAQAQTRPQGARSPRGSVAPRAKSSTVERQMAEYAAGLRFEDLPPEVVAAVKRVLADSLACAFGALDAPPAKICEKTYRTTFAGAPKASVIGGSQAISVEGAALVNGVLVRYLDLNDVYVGKDPIHPSECIPSALACCEEQKLDGKRLIEALVVGYETQLALVDSISFSQRGFHSLSCAGYAVPLIACKLRGLSVEHMINAMGIAAPRMFCLLAINRGPISMMKALPYGHDAMDALFATRLAEAGFTGAAESISWFAANVKAKGPDSPFTLRPGEYRTTRVGLKRFPLQFELQTVAEAGADLHDVAKGRLADLRAIEVETYPATIERTADPSRYRPATKETADHSLPVCLAMALLDGDVTVDQFVQGRWRDADVLALAQKVSVKPSPRLVAARPKGAGVVVRLLFSNGPKLEKEVDVAEGDPDRPMSPASLKRKFMQPAAPRLGAKRAEAVLALVDRLEDLPDVGVLMSAMRRG